MTIRLANSSTNHRRHGPRFLWYSSALLLAASTLYFLMNLSDNYTTLVMENAKQDDVVYTIRKINVNHNDTNNGNGNDKIADESFSTYSAVSFADVNAKGSALILLKAATEPRLVIDEAIDIVTERSRCERYNLTLPLLLPKRRRIFWGSLIADDSWHAIAMIAMESYGIFHTAAFVESNRTQNFSSRKLRFPPGSKMKSFLQSGGLFGPSSYSSSSTSPNMSISSSATKVSVDYFVNENNRLEGLGREQEQRALILQRWKANGMTGDDIGYLSDTDESFSRDFIRAMQICDVPAFRQADTIGNCSKPKVAARATIIFEGSPLCVHAKRWYHPDMIIGECLDGIGNANRTSSNDVPLWTAGNFRNRNRGGDNGHRFIPKREEGKKEMHLGFHYHNAFESVDVLRNKYKTYGHPKPKALTAPIGEIHKALDLMMECALNNHNQSSRVNVSDGTHSILEGGIREIRKLNNNSSDGEGGPIPLAFLVPNYVEARHAELRDMLSQEVVTEPRPKKNKMKGKKGKSKKDN